MSSQALWHGGEATRFYEFGPFRIDVANRFLLRDGNILPLSIKAFDLLLVLVKHRGDVVEKTDLMRQVWSDSFVEEGNLSHHVFMLRKQLGDQEHEHAYIETIPRRGYRFAADVRETHGDAAQVAEALVTTRAPRRAIIALVAAAVVLILAAFIAIRSSRQSIVQAVAVPIRSVAVLPFQSSDDYSGAGIADVLTTRLSAHSGLIVRSTRTVADALDSNKDAAAIGRRLGVDAVVDGRVVRTGERVHATARLVRSIDAALIWSGQFDEDGGAPFVVEDAIAERILHSSAQGSRNDGARLTGSTSDPEAYRQYIIGRSYVAKASRERANALPYFQRAVVRDPRFALAYAGIAETWSTLGVWGVVKPEEWVPPAEQAAIRALQLDGNLSEAQTALASVRIYGYWDWKAGENGFRRALQLNPGNALAQRQLAHCLQLQGRFDEAIAARKRACELDPVSPVLRREAALTYYMARRYDDAIREHETALAMNPKFDLSLINIGNAYVQKGQTAKGIEYLERAVAAGDLARPNAMAWLAHAYRRAGRAADAARTRDELTKLGRTQFVQPYILAIATLAGGDDTDRVFALLEECYRTRSVGLINLKTDPAWDSLRSDRRFANLLHRMTLDR